jgi:hypothetical protein
MLATTAGFVAAQWDTPRGAGGPRQGALGFQNRLKIITFYRKCCTVLVLHSLNNTVRARALHHAQQIAIKDHIYVH